MAKFILSPMSKSMAEQIREEIQTFGSVKEAGGKAAVNSIMSQIREVEAAGEILLLAEDEE